MSTSNLLLGPIGQTVVWFVLRCASIEYIIGLFFVSMWRYPTARADISSVPMPVASRRVHVSAAWLKQCFPSRRHFYCKTTLLQVEHCRRSLAKSKRQFDASKRQLFPTVGRAFCETQFFRQTVLLSRNSRNIRMFAKRPKCTFRRSLVKWVCFFPCNMKVVNLPPTLPRAAGVPSAKCVA